MTTRNPRITTSDDYKDDIDLDCALGTPASALEYLLSWPGDVIILTLTRHCHHEWLFNLKQKIVTLSLTEFFSSPPQPPGSPY